MFKMISIPAAVLLFLQLASPAMTEPPAASDVQASLLCDVSSLKPGDSFTLAVVLKTNPEWHIYWRNPGDAGMPTRFTLHLPDGFKADAVAYPLPTQFNQPGNILAYGYTGDTVFLIHVIAPRELSATQNAELKINAGWLSCNSDRCMPGHQELAITLPIATQIAPNPANQQLIEKARKQIPADGPPPQLVTASSPAVSSSASPIQLSLQLDWKDLPVSIEAFPLVMDGLEISNLKIQTERNRTEISMNSKLLPGQKLTSDHLQVLIAYTDSAGQRQGFYTLITLPAPASENRK